MPATSSSPIACCRFGASYSPQAVIKYLKDRGYERVPSNGGHQQYQNAEGHKVPVPVHGTKKIQDRLLSKMARQLGMQPKDFRRELDRYA